MLGSPLFDTLEGDLNAFRALRALPVEDLEAIARSADIKPVRAAAVRRVLLALAQGHADSGDVQAWASFIRWGYFESRRRVAFDLDIPYDQNEEEAIVDAIGRMTELGDYVDGTIEEQELHELLERLG